MDQTNYVMPPEIAKAIVEVGKKIKLLAHDERNKYQGWRYTSVDAFYYAVGPLMAEAGLFTIVDEAQPPIVETRETTDDRGQNKSGKWLATNYEIRLFHASGAYYGPIHRTMVVRASGPQSFGVGMSYVDKYFLRGLFKVPTGEIGGDDDADSHEQTDLPETRDMIDWATIEEAGRKILRQAKTADDLKLAWDSLSMDQHKVCWQEKDKLKLLLQQKPATPAGPAATEAAEAESPVARWIQLLEIAGKDIAAMNAMVRDDFVKLHATDSMRNEIWTLISNCARSAGWKWDRERKAFTT